MLFFDKKPGAATPWTKQIWIYDLRTNKHFTLKTNPLQRSDLDEFVSCFNSTNRHLRRPTWSEANPQGRWLGCIEHAHHESVGDDGAGRLGAGGEEAQGMARRHHEGLMLGHLGQVLLDEEVLHPVLADLARLAVGDELVGVKGHVEVQVVVDHDLHPLGLQDAAGVLVDGFPEDSALGAEAVAVDAPPGEEFVQKLECQLFVEAFRDIAQGVLEGRLRVLAGEPIAAARCAADALLECLLGRQYIKIKGEAGRRWEPPI